VGVAAFRRQVSPELPCLGEREEFAQAAHDPQDQEAFMLAKGTFVAALAVAVAIAFSPLPELRAAPLGPPGSQPGSGDLVQSVQAKKASKKKAGKKKKGKRKKAKGKTAKAMKSCGTFKYHKGGKCLDARDKK
jgi:hypothetical protein